MQTPCLPLFFAFWWRSWQWFFITRNGLFFSFFATRNFDISQLIYLPQLAHTYYTQSDAVPLNPSFGVPLRRIQCCPIPFCDPRAPIASPEATLRWMVAADSPKDGGQPGTWLQQRRRKKSNLAACRAQRHHQASARTDTVAAGTGKR